MERPVFVPPFVAPDLEALLVLVEKAGFSVDRKEVAGAAKADTAWELKRAKAAVTTAV
jgi:hypothetical protein